MFDLYSSFRNKFKEVAILSLGAVPGAFIRWQLDNDLLLNIFGALILGFVFGLPFRKHYHLVIGIGFCGSLTTFSGWMLDSAELLLSGFLIKAFGLIIYTFSLGLLSATFGFFFGRRFKQIKLFLLRFLIRRY